jgi:Mlc titration factor MtfA (ptsG expression regulator)
MFRFLRNRLRKKLMAKPFPDEWEKHLVRNMAHFRRLTEAEKCQLRGLVQVFVAEKYWEGCGGLELDDEIRVTIAAHACLLLLGLQHSFYRNVQSILVYPSTVVHPGQRFQSHEIPQAPVETLVPILGEAIRGGPVILVWDAVQHGGRHPARGINVVYHEFAHKLDMLDGSADGTPPFLQRDALKRWMAVCERTFLALQEQAKRGEPTFLDTYGATNEAEFFAVITEQFFDEPTAMREHHLELYTVLQDFYHQDPASRE